MKPDLEILYDPETDTLDLWNGLTASIGDDIAENVIVFFDNEGQYNGVTIEYAAKLLVPYLTGAKETASVGKPKHRDEFDAKDNGGPSKPNSVSVEEKAGLMGDSWNRKLNIRYHQQSDTLWLANGLPTPNGVDIAENVTVFFDDDDQPNGLMVEHAAELLLPVLMTAKEKADSPNSKGL